MNKIEKIQPSHIFTNYIYKAIPLAFDESMSYYETLCGVLDLLHTHTEVINNNAEVVEELESYVENYFENLDVQEEINNKLDEMAEDGTLENIISEYIQLATTYVYNNVAEMKEATNLINGSYARTSGYYSYNDEGGAFYKIRTITNEDVVDEMTIIALDDVTLVAELVKQNTMNVKQFGAKGDGETDDTDVLQTALTYNKNIIINNGTYMIDSESGILPQSNNYIEIINATLKAITNNLETYNIIDINNVANVTICGNGSIQGDKTTHTGLTGEHGHCIKIQGGATNILIKDVKIIDGWGDGIYVGDSNNIVIDNTKIDNNSRNGISVVKTNNCKIINSIITGTNRTAPKAGIDIEPNNTDTITNVLIENCIVKNNSEYGITTANRYPNDYPNAISNIIINNNIIDNNKIGIRPEYTKQLVISNNIIINNETNGITIAYTHNSVIDGNQIENNGYAISLYLSNSNLISNNAMIKCTTTNPVLNSQGCKYNIIKANLIKENKRGINLTSTTISDVTYESSYNRIEENDIYNNSVGNSGTYHNISLSNTNLYNFIKNNNFIGDLTDDIGYNIQVASNNSRNNNFIIGNIMLNGNSGAMNIYNNKTLDNLIGTSITTLALDNGNLRT